MNELMTAKEARAKAETKLGKLNDELLSEVISKINQAIDKNGFEASGDGSLPAPLIKLLEAKGYTVKHGSQYNESYWMVRW
jgi:hypothetical protein